jgi:hypothetical protein
MNPVLSKMRGTKTARPLQSAAYSLILFFFAIFAASPACFALSLDPVCLFYFREGEKKRLGEEDMGSVEVGGI